MASFLEVALLPVPCIGLVEGLHSPECEIHLMPVVANHLCEVVHKCIIVLRCKVVFVSVHIPTAAQTAHQFDIHSPSAYHEYVVASSARQTMPPLCWRWETHGVGLHALATSVAHLHKTNCTVTILSIIGAHPCRQIVLMALMKKLQCTMDDRLKHYVRPNGA